MHVSLVAVLLLCASAGTLALPRRLDGKDGGNIYALLVAGSNTWMNYRHQADLCHAYQILKKHGVPDDNIVVMMYDDIAHSPDSFWEIMQPNGIKIYKHSFTHSNPDKGVIINHMNGPNVYPGVPHDYTKEEVTPENFLNILQGNAEAVSGVGSGKVLRSGPNDYVFVNFVDHGAPGIVAFPDDQLTAKELNDVIKKMHSQKKFKQMVLFVEACESGSMFANLSSTDNVYAVTAANPHESSYACYYDSKLETYLGDVFSVNWMENVDSDGTAAESLEELYKVVKKETNTSHVMQYGDLEFDSDPLQVFMGAKNNGHTIGHVISPSDKRDAVPSGDVPIAVLMHKIHGATDYWQKKKHEEQLMEELMMREKVRSTMEEIVRKAVADEKADSILGKPAKPTKFDCYKPALKTFSEKCFSFSKVEYALRHVYALSNLCEAGVDTQTILDAIEKVC